MSSLPELVEKVEVVCQSAATFLAMIRKGREEEVLKRLEARAKATIKIGAALAKFDYKGHSLTYVAPDRLIVRLKDAGTLEDAKALLAELLA
ncbi:MAG: hypothetical protein LM580_00680 [Thermofilum sp.]|nr:hypothetical protein [Thermofilum sp.]MCC6064531.1 hypothetical protein [Thermofilum sp.]